MKRLDGIYSKPVLEAKILKLIDKATTAQLEVFKNDMIIKLPPCDCVACQSARLSGYTLPGWYI